MYEEFFGLQRRPFSATPDANCFVPLESHQGVLDALAVSCERGQGIGVLTGESGLGKSLVGLRLAFELQPTFVTAFLGHSAYATRRALLQAILFELHRPYDRMAEQELRLELAATLKSLRAEQQGFVLIVDEAHRLSAPLLDEVRMLTLLADGGEPLARAVLIGDRDLEERLADSELASFNQHLAVCEDCRSAVEDAQFLNSLVVRTSDCIPVRDEWLREVATKMDVVIAKPVVVQKRFALCCLAIAATVVALLSVKLITGERVDSGSSPRVIAVPTTLPKSTESLAIATPARPTVGAGEGFLIAKDPQSDVSFELYWVLPIQN